MRRISAWSLRIGMVCSLAVAPVTSGCDDATNAELEWTLRLVSGGEQFGSVGDTLAPVLVRVTAADGTPAERAGVIFTVTEGFAFIENAEGNMRGTGVGVQVNGVTDADGETFVTFALGTEVGVYSLRAEILRPGDSVVDVNAFAGPGPAQQVVRVGDGQVGAAGDELGAPVGVLVADEYGNPIFNHLVVWVVSSGGGSLSADSVSSNDGGAAYVRWTLGSAVGAQSVTGMVENLGEFLFTATAR